MELNANILERIAVNFAELSPAARGIATYIQQNPLTLLSMSLAELATATQTSKASVSRLFRTLGYASHQEAKQALLLSRTKGFPVPSSSVNDQSYLANEMQNIQQSFQDLSSQYTAEIGALIANARHVYIVGFRNAYPIALHFRQQLMQIRSDVMVLPQPGQTLGEDLVDLCDQDLVIVFGFRRRPAGFEQLVRVLPSERTILITDPTGQVFNKDVKHLLVCHLGSQEAFDSYAAAMSLVALLCNKVYQAISPAQRSRAAKISAWYSQVGEISKL